MNQKASGSVKLNDNQSYIVAGHGRVAVGQVINKVVPGRGRVLYEVSASGSLIEIK